MFIESGFLYRPFFYLPLLYTNGTIFISSRKLQNGWSKPVRGLENKVLLIFHQIKILMLIFFNLSGDAREYAPLPTGPGAVADVKPQSDEAVNIS